MMRRLLMWITARLPVREITHQGAPYLERYYVTTLLGWRVYIHRFVGPDPDGLHDHPFRHSFSIILAGWYLEERRDGTRARSRFNWIGADTFHRVTLPIGGGDVWTLFCHTRRVKQWGFMRPVEQWAKVNGLGLNGSIKILTGQYGYTPVNDGDRGHATWHKTAVKGRDLRATRTELCGVRTDAPAVFRRNRSAS
jgi:hypothetical protein